MDTRTLLTVIAAAGRAGVPVLLWGPPGAGKSSRIEGLAAHEQVACETVIGSLREPSDFAGLPVVTDGGVRMEAPSWAKRLHGAGGGYLFLDEVSTAAPAVQAAMLGVALNKRVGDLQLPDAVRVVAAANPPGQAAGGWELEAPLANRFLHVDFAPPSEEWVSGMVGGFGVLPPVTLRGDGKERRSVLRAQVAAFIKHRPTLLHAVPANAAAAGRAWPSPRTWTMTADTLAFLPEDDTAAIFAVVNGLVGEGAAAEFLTWRREMDLPTPAEVLADPAAVDWSGRPDRVWAILAGVVSYCTAKNTVTAWKQAWGPVMHASKGGSADVAAHAARELMANRPLNAVIPPSAKSLMPLLIQAGLIIEEVA